MTVVRFFLVLSEAIAQPKGLGEQKVYFVAQLKKKLKQDF